MGMLLQRHKKPQAPVQEPVKAEPKVSKNGNSKRRTNKDADKPAAK